jgi:hypothetical protein
MAVVYLGSAVFKIARLTYVALFFVHLFACMFYRVKMEGADSPAEVVEFYTSRNVAEDVRRCTKSCSRTDHPKFY